MWESFSMSRDDAPTAAQVAYQLRVSDLEKKLREYDPARYTDYIYRHGIEQALSVGAALIAGIMTFALVIAAMPPGGHDGDGKIIFSIFAAGLAWVIVGKLTESLFRTSDTILDSFERELYEEHKKQQFMVKTMAQKIDEVAAKKLGTTLVKQGPGAIYVGGHIISSEVKTSIVQLEPEQPEVAEALKTIVGYVSQQKNAEAGEALTNLSEAISNKQKPSQIKAYWNELVRILPDAAKLTEAANTIVKIFTP